MNPPTSLPSSILVEDYAEAYQSVLNTGFPSTGMLDLAKGVIPEKFHTALKNPAEALSALRKNYLVGLGSFARVFWIVNLILSPLARSTGSFEQHVSQPGESEKAKIRS